MGLSVSTTWGSETTQSGPPSPMPSASLNSAVVPDEPVLQPSRAEVTPSIASPEQQQSASNHNVSQPSSGQTHATELATSLSGPQEIRPPLNPRLGSYGSPSVRSDREDFQGIFSELMTGTEHELSFLIRHYSDTVGPWSVCSSPPFTLMPCSNPASGSTWRIRGISSPRMSPFAQSMSHSCGTQSPDWPPNTSAG